MLWNTLDINSAQVKVKLSELIKIEISYSGLWKSIANHGIEILSNLSEMPYKI